MGERHINRSHRVANCIRAQRERLVFVRPYSIRDPSSRWMSSFNHKATLYSGGRCRTLKIDSANTNTTLEKLVVTGFVALFLLFLLHCLHSLGSGRHCGNLFWLHLESGGRHTRWQPQWRRKFWTFWTAAMEKYVQRGTRIIRPSDLGSRGSKHVVPV